MWLCVSGNSSAITCLMESLEQWSYSEFRGFKRFSFLQLYCHSAKWKRKTNYTFLVISMFLTLESVALCVTCQACHKQKKKGKEFFYQHWGWNVWWGHSRLSYVRLMHSCYKRIYQFVQYLISIRCFFEKISWPNCFCMGKWYWFWVVIMNLLNFFQRTCIGE